MTRKALLHEKIKLHRLEKAIGQLRKILEYYYSNLVQQDP
ncbi:MAG: hypothetical protein K0S08_1208 [Gammaproteobacteria bacterium]|jgi:hypothetical protein|nr:hypothetical protein [Gammaproteobacteria bacterium]